MGHRANAANVWSNASRSQIQPLKRRRRARTGSQRSARAAIARIAMSRSYVRKTARPYVQISPTQIAMVENWYRARMALGNQKVFAARIGLSIERVQALVAKIRREGLAKGKEV
jgi:DNA-binding transcriptional regulator YdaS (Cro superfamily)